MNERPLGFLRVWALIETVAVVVACVSLYTGNDIFAALSGGMLFVLVTIGSWMSVADGSLFLAASIAFALFAILLHFSWWTGVLLANVLLLLGNMPQNIMLLLSSNPTLRKRI
ncbi:MAG: hypothetical protein WBD37_11495 [Anderseniella sp.]